MVDAEEVEQYLSFGNETRAFEVKGPGSVEDKEYCAKIARAAMAMGNLRDGGRVCLGIDEAHIREMLPGLSDEQSAGWSDFDRVSAALSRYSDPPVTFAIVPLTLGSGAKVVVLDVEEFETTPHICVRDSTALKSGVVYVRSRGKPQSVAVPTVSEMRELLDLAIAKGVRDFVRRADLAGLLAATPPPNDRDRHAFAAEATEAWSARTAVSPKFDTLAYFDIAVRPRPFDAGRIAPADLLNFITAHTVRMRGWPVPLVDLREQLVRHATWIGQDTSSDVVSHAEAWRQHSSGQFTQRRVLTTDLRDASELRPTAPGAVGAVALWDVLLYLVEVAELAARVATALECEAVAIEASLHNVADRELVSGDWSRQLIGPYVVNANDLHAAIDVTAIDLLTDPAGVGIALTQQLVGPFGLSLPDEVLRDWQAQVLRR